MLKRIVTALLCVVLLSQCCMAFAYDGTEYDGPIVTPADAPTVPYANFAILYEETTGTVMYTKQADRTNAPASMTGTWATGPWSASSPLPWISGS